MAQTILVTGSNGQLGSELQSMAASYPAYRFVFLTRKELPLDDAKKAEELIALHLPDFLINCAAYTAVDKAESDQDEAERINGKAVGDLARICNLSGVKFIHISTDYVFNGQSDHPWKEDDPVDPVNAYGASKLSGEKAALKSNPDSIIIRTSWVYSSYGKNFVKTMLRLMQEKESIGVVADQVGSPTYAADLAEAIMAIIVSGKWIPGIFHFSNNGNISWHQFAVAIKELTASSCTVNGISTDQYPTPARRPHYSVMDTGKIVHAFGIELKDWKNSLSICLSKIRERREL